MKHGSLIECIENKADEIGFNAALNGFLCPEIGVIYTCDGIKLHAMDGAIVFLLELKQHNQYTGDEFGYPIEWFREVQPPYYSTNEVFSPETCQA